jgi:Predicted membrane protein (DUF2142)
MPEKRAMCFELPPTKLAAKGLLLALVLSSLVTGAWAARSFGGGGRSPGARTRGFTLGDAPLLDLQSLRIDPPSAIVTAVGPYPSFTLTQSSPPDGRAITSVCLSLKPLQPFNYNNFLLLFVAAAGPPRDAWGPQQEVRLQVVRGRPLDTPNGVCIRWNLPEGASVCTALLPEGAAFRLERLEVTETDDGGPRSARAAVLRLLPPGLLAALALVAVQALFPGAAPGTRAVKAFVLATLGFTAAVLAFLLPPFQGPDEWLHWRTALGQFGRGSAAETPLVRLYEILEAGRIRFRPDNQFHPVTLRTPSTWDPHAADSGPADYDPAPYASFLTYPIVGVVCLAFPKVEGVSEALVFYYLCRLLPLALLFALLFAANCRHRLPYVALVFFSSPLVLQQFTVVSSDTVPNLAALLAALLFLGLQERPNPARVGLLTVVCLAAVLAKPPALAGLLLLPLLCVPGDWVPRKEITLPLAGLLAMLLGIGVACGVIRFLRADPSGPAAKQLEFLGSAEGARTFLAACYAHFAHEQQWLADWFHPLGWVDTHLSRRHLELIRASVCVALVLDAVREGPALLAGVRQRKARAGLLIAALAAVWLVLGLVSCFALYVMQAPLGFPGIPGFQTRYLIPAAILTLLIPQTLIPPDHQGEEGAGGPRGLQVVNTALALGLLPLLFVGRLVELVCDLLTRYW